ncbi:MAG: DNA-directed RNA polymerase subunit omega [Nitrospirae bacterium GWD2_57_9]|nr:MAG: DNA-directed RNA polymerase subunit omega [Nitrospirae bacterium GWD2_57_9]OGW47537.1 MAG: DNA-directed RNA polymerase subunit omega [Nitrospirae bacterium GWC2_57_9]
MQQPQAEDIISLPIQLTDKMADTKFRLVHIASQRVRQLSSGAPMLVSSKSIKDTTIALEETLIGKFKIIVGEEAKKAKEEFRKREERAKLEEQLSAKEEEIRKELSAYLSESQTEEGSEEALSVEPDGEAVEGETEEPGDAGESDEQGE